MSRYSPTSLRQLPMFASLSRRALAQADALLTPVTFDDGDLLCVEGQWGQEAFIIVSGTAQVSRGEELIATVGRGDIVGELALLGDGRRRASVTAIEPVKALVMSAQEFASVRALPGVDAAVQRVAAAHGANLASPVAAA